MIFRQLFESQTSTYTYLLGCGRTREALIIDPVIDEIERDCKLIGELGLKLILAVDTHIHADHITAAGELRRRFPGVKSAVSSVAGVSCADVALKEGDVLSAGDLRLRVIETAGHTNSCLCFYQEGSPGRLFTGDTLLVRGSGRTDFQNGSAAQLYDNVHQKLFTLPAETQVYPGHDYKGFTSSTIGEEIDYNPRLGSGRTKDEFIRIMSELKLADPKRMHEAVPANLLCGSVPVTN